MVDSFLKGLALFNSHGMAEITAELLQTREKSIATRNDTACPHRDTVITLSLLRVLSKKINILIKSQFYRKCF